MTQFLFFLATSLVQEAPFGEGIVNDEDFFPREPLYETNFTYELLNMLFYLGLLIGGLLLMTWVFKKFLLQRTFMQNDQSNIKILETRAISHKTQIHVLEYFEEIILLAESQTALTQLFPPSEKKDS